MTEETLRAIYDMLKTARPFARWSLPESSEITFQVTRSKSDAAEYVFDGDHYIRVSKEHNGHLTTMIVSVAHEMCHLAQVIRGGNPAHNKSFNRLAKSVCQHMGFDPKAF